MSPRTPGAVDAAPCPESEGWESTLARRAAEEALEHQRLSSRAERRLKARYANALLAGLFAQVLVSDVVFVLYASSRGVRWSLSAPVVDVWLAAAVVQVVGGVEVVTRHLFPRREAYST